MPHARVAFPVCNKKVRVVEYRVNDMHLGCMDAEKTYEY